MNLSLSALVQLAWRTVLNPREGAETVLALGVPRQALWTALLLVVVLSVIAGQLTTLLAGAAGAMVVGPLPLMFAALQFALLVLTAAAIHRIGRAMGGTGSFEESLLLVIWLQFVLLCLQVIQALALLVLPALAALLGLVGLFLFMWLLTNFIAVIHGFRSLLQVFLMVLVSLFGIAFALSILLALLGVPVPGG